MLFSIIIPTFNAEHTLARAVDSLLRQNRPERLEILIVDDGSQDATCELASQYGREHSNIRFLQIASNGGPGIARNLGLQHARGEWICFLDADDEWTEGAFAALADHLGRKRRREQPDILGFDWRAMPVPTSAKIWDAAEILRYPAKEDLIRAFLGNRIDPSVIYYAYRKAFLDRYAIAFHGGYHEDVDFSFRALFAASSLEVLSNVVYRKWSQAESIVNTLSIRHIIGYFDAIDRIFALLRETGKLNEYCRECSELIIATLGSRLARLLRVDIVKKDNPIAILEILYRRTQQSLYILGIDPILFRPAGTIETRYAKVFRSFIDQMPGVLAGDCAVDDFLAPTAALMKKSWSCYDLQNSLFLAPDEIRTCCKRYFYKGKMKGDVVLLKGGDQDEFLFSTEDIRNAKQRLHLEINRNNAPDCEGCPFLKFEEWGRPLEFGVKYLSLEYHSICNMRCTYCSPTYYGGKKQAYNVSHTIESLGVGHALDQCEYLVWGGGEPTLDDGFARLAPLLGLYAPSVCQRVITNATKFTPELAAMMSKDQAFIVVSLDAGTDETFRRIRKFNSYGKVLANVRRYLSASASNTILKYIALDDNFSSKERLAFVERMKSEDLLGANFQLSCDFRSSALSAQEVGQIASLHESLRTNGARFVFLDDLVWQRMPVWDAGYHEQVRQQLEDATSVEIANTDRFPDIFVWGTGAQAELMLQKSKFLSETRINGFIDPRPGAIGTPFMGKSVFAPSILHESTLPILIAAVQSAPFIYRALIDMGIDRNRIIQSIPL